MYNNAEVKNKIRDLLDENTSNDPLSMFNEYTIAYRANARNSRVLTLKDVSAKLAVVLRNTSNKIMIQKLNDMLENIKQIEKM